MITSLSTNHGRSGVFTTLGLMGVLAAASVFVQTTRDRWYRTDKPAEQILYVRSAETMRRMVLSYDALAADVYWIRAIQHFGSERLSGGRYDLLYPLLDLTTSLDRRYNIAYRFGALFLSEKEPGGPGRPDLAIQLLQKGIKEMPTKWQYYQDAGYVYYFGYNDYEKAAEWFKRGSEIEGADWFLKPLAAATLAKGNHREASRVLYETIANTPDNPPFMKKDANRRLLQLDTMDDIDVLQKAVNRYRERVPAGQRVTWETLIAARILRIVPHDREGFDLTLDPDTGEIRLNHRSTLYPLPTEEPEPPPENAPPVPWPSPIGLPPMLQPLT
jgi:hypothetical protein